MTVPRAGLAVRGRSLTDPLPVLTFVIGLSLVLPSRYVVGFLGAAGAPALLAGLLLSLLWLIGWFQSPLPRGRVRQPLKVWVLVFFATVLISYLKGALRPSNPEELLASDRSLLFMVAWIGIMLVTMDLLPGEDDLETLLRRLILLGGLEGCLGVAQFLTGQTLIGFLKLPGLTDNSAITGLVNRGGFFRTAGTAVHPIEFGVALSMMLPIALHLALADRERRGAASRWLPVLAIAVALPLSVSRSAIVCTGVSMAVLLPTWPPAVRRPLYAVGGALVAVLVVAIPGFMRTFTGLFLGAEDDSSTQSRTDSYALAWSFVERAPVFGRGAGTFLPRYRILDNQYLGWLIETGFVGLAVLLAFFLAGVVTAFRLGRITAGTGGSAPQLGSALAASIAGGAVSFAFFDAWGFPWVPTLMFLLLGCVGALRRLTARPESPPLEGSTGRFEIPGVIG